MSVPVFIELCAGTAALSLRLARARAKPPVSRMGAKTGYADAILSRMGLQPGQGAERYIWAEPEAGPRLLLECYRNAELAHAAAEVVRGWADEQPRALWDRLRAEGPVKAVEAREIARWVVSVRWSFSQSGNGYGGPGTASGMMRQRWRDETLGCARTAERIDGLPYLSARIVAGAADVKPARLPAGSWVYIDPPYVGTTKYAHDDLPRAEVVRLARAWHAAGVHVAVSEAVPLAELVADGWYAHELTHERVGHRRTFSKQQREWLTLTRAPRGQLSWF